ncbi:MAG: methyltransferase family protein [Spirosomataceae bacterium]
MKQITTSILIIWIMLFCPLLDKPLLMLDIKIIFPSICGLWLLAKQHPLDWKVIKANAKTDGYSTIMIVIAGMISQSLPIFEWKVKYYQDSALSNGYNYLGIMMLFGGLYLRLEAISTLNSYFTNEVRIGENWKLIQNGLYKKIRHPSYTGGLVSLLGTSILFESFISFFISLILLLSVYIYRITLEEKELIRYFGEKYVIYQKSTKALLPFIY